MSFSVQAIENAIRAWVKTGSGLDDAHVLFATQDGPQPSGSFITIKLLDLAAADRAATDEVKTDYDVARAAGLEIRQTATAMLSLGVSLQAFTPFAVGGGASITGWDLLRRVQRAASLDTVAAALNAAGLGLYDRGTVQNVPAIVGAKFEGRGALTVRFYLSDDASNFTGYIADITATDYLI